MQRPLVLALLSLLLFVGLALPAAHHLLLPGDELVYRTIQAEHSWLLTAFFQTVTKTGSYWVLAPVWAGVLLWQLPNWGLCLFLILYAYGVPQLRATAKQAVARPRPSHSLVAKSHFHSYGFPSGHALAAVAFYGMFLVLWHRRGGRRGWQWGITGGLLLLILLIGVSRIYLGAHWPSDVLGGYALGVAYCSLATAVYGWMEPKGVGKSPLKAAFDKSFRRQHEAAD